MYAAFIAAFFALNPGHTITGCNCLESKASLMEGIIKSVWAIIEFGLVVLSSCPNGTKYTFLQKILLAML